MKKNVTKNAFYRGFTLIELMIVIVILGVLMGTILPRLSSAQARSRDLGRVADLNTIAQALETYFDDHGEYPGKNTEGECLSGSTNVNVDTDHSSAKAIEEYLKANQIPSAPASEQEIEITTTQGTVKCTGGYFYVPLANRGLEKNGYLLAIDMETYQNANFLLSALTISLKADTTTVTPFVYSLDQLRAKDKSKESNTIYVVTN